jgi:hypothetical protein
MLDPATEHQSFRLQLALFDFRLVTAHTRHVSTVPTLDNPQSRNRVVGTQTKLEPGLRASILLTTSFDATVGVRDRNVRMDRKRFMKIAPVFSQGPLKRSAGAIAAVAKRRRIYTQWVGDQLRR